MAAGQFREDLFFRLSVFQIRVPPLRDRREDIPALAEHFLRHLHPSDAPGVRLSAAALAELRGRPWAGNVRELRNTVEHAAIVARSGTIGPEHLPPASAGVPAPERAPGASVQEALAHWARRQLQEARAHRQESMLHERLLELAEPPVLQAALAACSGNRAAAAQMLGIHRATLRQKLNKYGIG
jgi:two-component system nitrogen regulation response regulator GlnG